MLIQKRRAFLFGALAAFAVVVMVGLAPTLTPSYQKCQSEQSQTNAENNSAGNAPNIVAMDRLGIFLECWGTTANANGDAITALTTVVIAVFTGVLTGVGRRQTTLAEMGAEAFRVVERAYVRMSHETPKNGPAPSALTFNAGVPHVRMEVKNWGATPARVTELVLQPDVRPSGDPLPPYNSFRFDPPQRMEAFVVPNTAFYFPGSFTRAVDVAEIEGGRTILRLIGYVEYTDKFGHRHRSGYARQYFPGGARNNLSFVTEAGYNDDTPIPS